MAETPDFFTSDRKMTDEGKQLLMFLDETCKKADHDRVLSLSGHIGHYFVNVYKGGWITPEQWLWETQHSMARASWSDLEYFTEQAQAIQAVPELQADNAALIARITTLEEVVAAFMANKPTLKDTKKARKAKVAEAEAEAEPQAEVAVAAPAVEPEPEAGPEDDEEEKEQDEEAEAEDEPAADETVEA